MELRLATPDELRLAYRKDLLSSFPPSELRPLSAMLRQTEEGSYRPRCLFDGETIVGEAFVQPVAPGWALFDYLCVSAEKRSAGLGSELIARLRAAEGDSVLFGESEIPQYAPDPALAQRRIGFYLRNGAQQAGYTSAIFGVPYVTLYWSPRPLADAELMEMHRRAYCGRFSPAMYQKNIIIPWDASRGIPEKFRWKEE